MKTIKLNFQMTKITLKKVVMLLFFLAAFTTGAYAQNSCLVQGYSGSVGSAFNPAFVTLAQIESCASGANLKYAATPSIPSTFSWSLSVNTSGASIVGPSNLQYIEVMPGALGGSFTLTCVVTGIADTTEINTCAVSVAVYRPNVVGIPASRCGPGNLTLSASGFGSGVPFWYAASSGGTALASGATFPIIGLTTTTSFWVSTLITTPFLGLQCVGPRVEVIATIKPVPSCNITGNNNVCPGSTNTYTSTTIPADGVSHSWTIVGAIINGPTTGPSVSVTAPAACTSYTLTDNIIRDGCPSTCTQTFNVVDTTPPVFTFCPPGSNLGCNPTGVPGPGAATATDACGVPTITSALGIVSVNGCLRSQTRTYTATDGCLNTATCTQVFTWTVDITPPTFTFCPQGSDLGCNPTGVPAAGTATATDACGAPTITSALGTVSVNGCLRSQTRTYTATDGCLNIATCTQVFTWTVDITPPVFTFCPPGSNLGCNPTGVPAAGAATATDACGAPTITSALGTVSVNGCLRSQTRTYTATDGCLNTATCTQVFTWTVDITPPVFTFCPPGSDLGCNPTSFPAPGAATATDTCGAPTITSALGTVTSNGCLRSQTRTYTATDGCLNTATCTQVFTWLETPPVIVNSPDNAIVSTCDYTNQIELNAAFANWLSGFAIASGGCDPSGSYGQVTVPSLCATSTTTVTYNVTDLCHTSSVTKTFTINTAPKLNVVCPGNVTLTCEENGATAFATWIAGFSHNGGCTAFITTTDLTQYQVPAPGLPLVINYTAADNCDSVTCTSTFLINPCVLALCTYTQGAYGSVGGLMCDGTIGTLTTAQMIAQCLANAGGTITVGKPGRSVIMTSALPNSVSCVIDKLPGGGDSRELPAGNPNICSLPNSYLKVGKIKNVLLAQTITLSLNVNIENPSGLGSFKLQAGVIATANPQGGCGSSIATPRVCGHFNDLGIWVNTVNEYTYRTITANVVNAITPNGNGDKTVAGLVDLANRALANADGTIGSEGGASLSAINAAVDAINNVFDECMIFVGWNVPACPAALAKTSMDPISTNGLSMVAYPNPFKHNVSFEITSDVSGNATLEIFNILGQRVRTDINEYIEAGRSHKIDIDASKLSGTLIYVLTIGDKKVTGKLVKIE